MAVKKKFTQPLQVVETEETRNRINAIAEAEDISQAQVIRELIAYGIDARENLCETRTGALADALAPA